MAEGAGDGFGFRTIPIVHVGYGQARTSVTFSQIGELLTVMTTSRRRTMKDPVEVLRRKEAELERLQEEVDALRLVGKLLRGQSSSTKQEPASGGKILQMP
jgi:hypothetical protein